MYNNLIGGECMYKKNNSKAKLPKHNHILKQFQELIVFLISMTVAITTITKNILDIFK
jgi:hypothetical protein